MKGARRLQAEFLDVGHVIHEAGADPVAVTQVRARPGRKVAVELSDGTTRVFRPTDIVEVT